MWNCENGKYLARVINVSAVMCDEAIYLEDKSSNEETKTLSKNLLKKNPVKRKSFILCLHFY